MNIRHFLNKKQIFWHADISKINLKRKFDRRWCLKQILMYATMDEIKKMDYRVIKKEIEFLDLPENINHLWENYFKWRQNGSIG
ncbi:MAG: hypothetical protein V1833_02180 [Elusimicrobiota bacterium]